MGQRLHWAFEDPAAFEGSEEERWEEFREVRNQIDDRINQWLAEVGSCMAGALWFAVLVRPACA